MLPANLSPGLAEIIRLAQAHVEEGVILSFIQTSGQVYSPSAEEILYLSDLGLPQNVIAALFKDKPMPNTPPIATSPVAGSRPPPGPEDAVNPAATPEANFFYKDLSPYGAWVEVPDYGLSWQPAVETIDTDWSPYLDRGQWVDSETGWYWLSDYTWGWAVFHYGRWVKEPRLGWVWVPGNVWSPAWVAWRSTGDYYGWGPLPPGASVLGAATSVTTSSFVFVPANQFLSRQLRGKVVPPARSIGLFAKSKLLKNYVSANSKVVSGGITREEVAAAIGKPLRPVKLRSVSSPEAVAEVADRSSLPVYRPDPATAAAAAWSQSGALQGKKAVTQPVVAPSTSQQDQVAVTDTMVEESSPFGENGGVDMALPPLHYSPGVAAPMPNKKFGAMVTPSSPVNPTSTSAPQPVHHHPSHHMDQVERPTTPPPQLEQSRTDYAAANRAVESAPHQPPPPPPQQSVPARPNPPAPAGAISSSRR
jgi:hypothetical protein